MNANDLRSSYLDFFKQRGHEVVASASLVPDYDPTLLFTGAGMNQFKDDFLGKGTRPYKRATSSQKCIRTQDLEIVGRTNFHHTFFEMLGNFSFGDYFKKESIAWAWEYLTEVLKLDPKHLRVSIYKTDEEAYEYWTKNVGVDENSLYRFGEADNYWPANSPNDKHYRGPCGPCSEIFWDYGEQYASVEDSNPSTDNNRYVEVWNLVFQQFNKVGPKPTDMEPLPAPGIDTGMGFERILAVVNGQRSAYETGVVRPIIDRIAEIAGKSYTFDMEDDHVRMRRIADHVRAACFCIADGVWVENEGRGYVLKKVIRRAVRDGRQLGIDGVFLDRLADTVVDIYADAYPELREGVDQIKKRLADESRRFLETLDKGEARLSELIGHHDDEAWIAPRDGKLSFDERYGLTSLRKVSKKVKLEDLDLPKGKHVKPPKGVLDGMVVHDLEQTFGFPGEVTKFILAHEHGFDIDEIGYDYAVVRHMLISGAGGDKGAVFDTTLDPAKKAIGKTEFVGYDTTMHEPSKFVILDDEGNELTRLEPGQRARLFVDTTPFYSEAGGQVGDTGVVKVRPGGAGDSPARSTKKKAKAKAKTKKAGAKSAGRAGESPAPPGSDHTGLPVDERVIRVLDCVNRGELREHTIELGDDEKPIDLTGVTLSLEVDVTRRDAIRRNHTATHLLHHALRLVLGDHVHQKGSLVAPDRLRFDFTHDGALTDDEITRIEHIANAIAIDNDDVATDLSTPDEAKARGAMALFGEKYGDRVRVVTCGPTMELCGGTHVRRAGDIGAVRVVSQSAVSAGVRRVEAITGFSAVERFQQDRNLVESVAASLKAPADGLSDAVERLQAQIKQLNADLKKAREQAATGGSIEPVVEKDEGDMKLQAFVNEDWDRDGAKAFVDSAIRKLASGVVFAVGQGGAFSAKATEDLVGKGLDLGKVTKEHGKEAGIRGGGNSTFVSGQITKPKGDLGEALETFATILIGALAKLILR